MYVAPRDELKVMNIRRQVDTATIEMTDFGLKTLAKAITSWLAGGEDFRVTAGHAGVKPKQLGRLDRESGDLWFWGPGYEP